MNGYCSSQRRRLSLATFSFSLIQWVHWRVPMAASMDSAASTVSHQLVTHHIHPVANRSVGTCQTHCHSPLKPSLSPGTLTWHTHLALSPGTLAWHTHLAHSPGTLSPLHSPGTLTWHTLTSPLTWHTHLALSPGTLSPHTLTWHTLTSHTHLACFI